MLTINLEWDANALAASQSFRDGVQDAANILDAAIYDPITINVAVGYGEYDDGSTTLLGGISLGGVNTSIPISYQALKAALISDESAATDVTAFNSLPATESLNGQSTFYISSGMAKVLGVLPATNAAVDGYVGFPNNFTGSTLVGAGLVELMHAIGMLNDGQVLSLFEYTSVGKHLLNAGTTSTPAYFSIDGGVTDLADYDVGFDSTLFLRPSNDPFSVPISGNMVLTSLDFTEISAIGFNVTKPIPLPTPSITPTVTSAQLTGREASVAENTAMSASSLISSVSVPLGESIVSYQFDDEGFTGHFVLNGVVETNNRLIQILSTQLDILQYVGGSSTGNDLITIGALDFATGFYAQAQSDVTTVTPPAPQTINNADGTSFHYIYNPTITAAETITLYSGLNTTGTVLSDTVDNSSGTASLYVYNPTACVTLTITQYSATNTSTGAPIGSIISNIVDNTDGTSLLYAYNPTRTVTQTTSKYSATDAANGAPAGMQVSDVVANSDGTALLYAYNPTSTVTQTTARYTSTDASNGAPSGTQISDVVDNMDGTAILYAYNPTSGVGQTASYYASSDPTSGAPTGALIRETIDYINAQSSIITYASNGSGSAVHYSGPDGTGSVTSGTAAMAAADFAATTDSAAQAGSAPASNTIAVIGLNQLIDPGTGSHTIHFLSGTSDDTLVLHTGACDQVLGFDPTMGDQLALSSLLAEAQVNLESLSQLGSYVSVDTIGDSAQILFDPSAQGGGMQVALLAGDGSLIMQIQAALGVPHLA